jgi:hypothetical protein
VGVLQRFEQRLESLVNGAFARAFKAEVQPVEIASALQRELDNRAAIVSRERTMVPNRFVVQLASTDHERLGIYSDALRSELADVVREHAQEQRYSLMGPVDVSFEKGEDLDTGVFRVRSEAQDAPPPAVRRNAARPAAPARSAPAGTPYLQVEGRRYPLTSALAVLGRGTEADVRIDDPGVSRRHAEVTVSGGLASIADLGSTNGLVVDGMQVRQASLQDGSEIVLGATTVVYRSR